MGKKVKGDQNLRETATILAALRHWQKTLEENDGKVVYFDGHFDEASFLDSEEIDSLCERINCSEWPEKKAVKPTYYVLHIQGGIYPELSWPFKTDEEREERARKIRESDDPETDAVLYLDIDANGIPTIY